MSKKNEKSKSAKKNTLPMRFVESDNHDGPWQEIPAEAIKVKITPLDEARLNNPQLNWIISVDLMTELYDEAMGCNTRLDSNGLKVIRKRFGENCTLRDIRLELENNNIKFEGKGWSFIVDYVKRLPDDLMTLTVAISRYKTSKSTLRRKIQKGEVKEYRYEGSSEILVSEKEIRVFAPPK